MAAIDVLEEAKLSGGYIVTTKSYRTILISLIIWLIGIFQCEACPLDIDTTLQSICNSLDSQFIKNEINVSHAAQGKPPSFNIERDGKVDISLVVPVINEATGAAVAGDANYSFYIQELNLWDETIPMTTFRCKVGKCIKVSIKGGRSIAVSELAFTAYSEKAANEFVKSLEVLRRMFGVPTKEREPIRLTCGKFDSFLPSIRVVGAKGDLFEIHHGGRVIYSNFAESREWMGGAQNQLDCNDVVISRDIVVIRLGWKNDLLMAFAFQYDNTGGVVSIWNYAWPIRDGENIDISLINTNLGGGDVLIRYGRKHDLFTRLCFSQRDKNWRRSSTKFVDAGIPICDNNIVRSTKVTVQ